MNIPVYSYSGAFATDTYSGEELYKVIEILIGSKTPITLDFKHIRICTSAFFNAAFFKFLKNMDSKEFYKLVKFENITEPHKQILDRTILFAEEFYSDENLQKVMYKVIMEDRLNAY